MKPPIHLLILIALLIFSAHAVALATEYTGQFDTTLVPYVEDDDEQVIFKIRRWSTSKGRRTF